MSANNAARRLVGGCRRTFSTNASLRRPSTRPISIVSPVRASRWSGLSVFALAASAGVLGFGLAAFALDGSPKRTASLFDSKMPGPKYASVNEMELVSEWILYRCCPKTMYLQEWSLTVFQGSEGDKAGDKGLGRG